MSQKKVDQYKEYKKNRKEILAKEKRRAKLGKFTAWAVVALIFVGVGTAIGVTLYNEHIAYLASIPSYKAESFQLYDYAGIQKEETEEATDDDSKETADEEPSSEATTK